MSTIPAEKIEAIRARADWLGIVGETVTLKRQGRSYVACCPFHQERTPSFSVTPEKGMFYCFGCHAGGDIFAFVMRANGLDFTSAVRKLAERTGVELAPLTNEEAKKRDEQMRLMHVLEKTHAICVDTLWSPQGAQAQRYLARRKLPATQAREVGLGLGPSDGHLLRLLQKEKINKDALYDAGLLGESGQHVLVAERLVLPIFDGANKLVGLGARRIGQSRAGPKYLQSRDTILFSKRTTLWGLNKAQVRMRQSRHVVLVEGFFDVLACHRAGILEAVATLGTQLTHEHVQMLKRLAEEATLVFDGDSAGWAAQTQVAAKLIGAGLSVRAATLPKGEDPDSLVHKEGADALVARIRAAQNVLDQALELVASKPVTQTAARSEAAELVMDLLAAMPQGVGRDLYIARLAHTLELTHEQLREHMTRREREVARKSADTKDKAKRAANADAASKSAASSKPPRAQAPSAPRTRNSARPSERHAIVDYELGIVRELLLFPQLGNKFSEVAEYLFEPAHQTLMEAIADVAHDPPKLREVIEQRVEDAAWRVKLTAVRPWARNSSPKTPEEVDEQARRTFTDILRRLKWRHVDVALRRVLGELAAAEAKGEATDLLLRRKRDLSARKRALAGPQQG